VLVGIAGCGEGNGAEAYQGAVDNDPYAWCDLSFGVVGGVLTGVSGTYTPRSLLDYGYTGDLDATRGAVWSEVTGVSVTTSQLAAGAATEVLQPLVSTKTYPVSTTDFGLLVDGISVTPSHGCIAEVSITFHGAAVSNWDAGAGWFAVAAFQNSDPNLQGPFDGRLALSTSMATLSWQGSTGAASARASYTIEGRFNLQAGVPYTLGLMASGSRIFQGPSFPATAYSAIVNVTLIKA
jgi:hypothetical protein